jgi:hypothetical protein
VGRFERTEFGIVSTRNVSFWPIASDVAAQANVGVLQKSLEHFRSETALVPVTVTRSHR